MKKTIAVVAMLAMFVAASAEEGIITLDLTNSTTPLSFNSETGAWTGTYDDDETVIVSQCYEFAHSSLSEYQTWWGFTASNSADNQRRDNYVKFQFSNMPKGGIVLNEDGTIKKSENGAPVVSADVPYMVAYYSFMSHRPIDMTFVDGKSYDPVGVYVTLNSYTYYTVEGGDSYCRPFSDGDKLTLTIHGVSEDESEKVIVVDMCTFTNGDITITRGWKYIDLTELGSVNELYFTMSSTDTGAYGDNTPEYFCLDKLMVKPSENSGMNGISAEDFNLRYDQSTKIVSVDGEAFIGVYDVAGRIVSSGDKSVDVSGLQGGIYIARSGNKSLKFAR